MEIRMVAMSEEMRDQIIRVGATIGSSYRSLAPGDENVVVLSRIIEDEFRNLANEWWANGVRLEENAS